MNIFILLSTKKKTCQGVWQPHQHLFIHVLMCLRRLPHAGTPIAMRFTSTCNNQLARGEGGSKCGSGVDRSEQEYGGTYGVISTSKVVP